MTWEFIAFNDNWSIFKDCDIPPNVTEIRNSLRSFNSQIKSFLEVRDLKTFESNTCYWMSNSYSIILTNSIRINNTIFNVDSCRESTTIQIIHNFTVATSQACEWNDNFFVFSYCNNTKRIKGIRMQFHKCWMLNHIRL